MLPSMKWITQDGNPVEILGTVPLRQRPVIVNAVLVALGALETIMSLASIFICLREVCQCYSVRQLNKAASVPNMNLLTADQSPEGQARAYRLLRWLGTGHNRPPTLPPHLYPQPHPPRPPRLARFYRTPAVIQCTYATWWIIGTISSGIVFFSALKKKKLSDDFVS